MAEHQTEQAQPDYSPRIKTVTIKIDDTPIAQVILLSDFSPRIAKMHLIAETAKAIKSKEFTAVLAQIGVSK